MPVPATTRSAADRALSAVVAPSTTNDASSRVCVPASKGGQRGAAVERGPARRARAAHAGKRQTKSVNVERELKRRELGRVRRLLRPAEAIAGRHAHVSTGGVPGSGVSGSFLSHPVTHMHANDDQEQGPHHHPHDSPVCGYDTIHAICRRRPASLLAVRGRPGARATAGTGLRLGISVADRVRAGSDRSHACSSSSSRRGRIRVVRSGTVLATDFLNLTSSRRRCGERGLLGLAFAPDYASSGRFYVNFTNGPATRSSRDSRARRIRSSPIRRRDSICARGDAARHHAAVLESQRRAPRVRARRVSLHRPRRRRLGQRSGPSRAESERAARQDAAHRRQRARRATPFGYRVPPDNPFLGAGNAARDEIWAFGLRNPWRYSFDDVARGGTGALVIGDVGQNDWEEIDYEPRGAGGRNYGWRNREGAHDNVTSRPLAYQPADESDLRVRAQRRRVDHRRIRLSRRAARRGVSRTILLRGLLGPCLVARAHDRWHRARRARRIAASTQPSSAAVAVLGNISSFGVDADGELYVVNHCTGRIVRITAPLVTPPAPTGLKIIKP